MRGTSPREMLGAFEKFLSTIPLEQYRNELQQIKTVEQDLPRDLNPLPDIYEAYWRQESPDFPSYEDFFESWWQSHLDSLDRFIRKYFWGCSYDFVRLGFKARLYRTLVSILTQFYFCYSWKAVCDSPLIASDELDMKGMDAETRVDNTPVAVQIKKETYRAEAREAGRFARREQTYQLFVEVPYTITKPEDWQLKVQRARIADNREKAQILHFCALSLQRWLANGFVVFQSGYPMAVEQTIKIWLQEGRSGKIEWREMLETVKHLVAR